VTIMTGSEPAALGGVGLKAPNPKPAVNPRGMAPMMAHKPDGGMAHKPDSEKLAHK
jgi:hypothetical protein